MWPRRQGRKACAETMLFLGCWDTSNTPKATGGRGYIALAPGPYSQQWRSGVNIGFFASLDSCVTVAMAKCPPPDKPVAGTGRSKYELGGAKPYMLVVTRQDVPIQVYSANVYVHLDMYNNQKNMCNLHHVTLSQANT